MHLARAARQHGGAVLAAVAAALFCACERVERRFGYDSQNVCLFATVLALVGLLLSETRPDRRAEKLTFDPSEASAARTRAAVAAAAAAGKKTR